MRFKLTLEYDGTNYKGWQKQENLYTIQGALEKSIELLTKEKVEVIGCGRTDSGVHALNMIAHFDLNKEFDVKKIISGLNFYLRTLYMSRFETEDMQNNSIQDIAILDCEKTDKSFHARFSAKMRYYRYIILNKKEPTAFEGNRVWQVYKRLNLDRMNECLKYLTGKRDWSCFRDSDCQANSPIRTINSVNLIKEGSKIIFEISAKSFLQHMVRNIVGTLVDVGINRFSISDFKNIIESKDRTKAGISAPPQGLYFVKVDY